MMGAFIHDENGEGPLNEASASGVAILRGEWTAIAATRIRRVRPFHTAVVH